MFHKIRWIPWLAEELLKSQGLSWMNEVSELAYVAAARPGYIVGQDPDIQQS